jgi:hypothetical protein
MFPVGSHPAESIISAVAVELLWYPYITWMKRVFGGNIMFYLNTSENFHPPNLLRN